MKLKKFMTGALVIMFGGFWLTGCSNQNNATGDGPILIGGTLCQTGIQAPLDTPAIEGIELAIDQINKDGGINGRQLEFKNIDGKSDPVTVGENAKQLIAEGAIAIITPSDYDFGSPAAQAAQEAGIVGISPAASSPLFGSALLGDKQFTLSMWNTTMGAVIAEYAYAQGARNIFVVTDDFIDYTKSLSRYFIERFKELGGTILQEDMFSQGKLDTSAILAHFKALETKPDAIYASSYLPDLATLLKDFRVNGIDLPIYGGDAFDDPALAESLGEEYANKIVFDTHSFLSEEAVPGFDDFKTRYEEKFGKALDAPWSMSGSDVVNVLTAAIKSVGPAGAAMAKSMEENTFECYSGQLKWSDAASGHEPTKAAAVVELVNAKPTWIGWKSAESQPRP
jgi:branched-chain amino acid transport system substrate-binding protein